MIPTPLDLLEALADFRSGRGLDKCARCRHFTALTRSDVRSLLDIAPDRFPGGLNFLPAMRSLPADAMGHCTLRAELVPREWSCEEFSVGLLGIGKTLRLLRMIRDGEDPDAVAAKRVRDLMQREEKARTEARLQQEKEAKVDPVCKECHTEHPRCFQCRSPYPRCGGVWAHGGYCDGCWESRFGWKEVGHLDPRLTQPEAWKAESAAGGIVLKVGWSGGVWRCEAFIGGKRADLHETPDFNVAVGWAARARSGLLDSGAVVFAPSEP